MKMLITYLLTAMLAWSPSRLHTKEETVDQYQSRLQSIATDIAAVCAEATEPPLYTGPHGIDRTALLVASIGFWESGFRRDVEQGQCPRGWCDNGHAYTLWQLHADSGITLDGNGFRTAYGRGPDWVLAHLGEVTHGPELTADRRLAIRYVLHVWRTSPYNFTTAKAARQHANSWWASHPIENTQLVAGAHAQGAP